MQKMIIVVIIFFVVFLFARIISVLNMILPKKEKPQNSMPIIGCIGDSITFGMGVLKNRKQECWPRLLECRLGEGFQVLNYGISGATLLRSGNRPYDKKFWNKLKLYQPNILIFMLGTNDSKPYNWNAEKYESELIQFVTEMKQVTSIKRIILMAPPFATPIDGRKKVLYDINNSVIQNEIRPIVKKVSMDLQTEFLDLFELTANHLEYYDDGVHPNKQGNEVIADAIYKIVTNNDGNLK